VATGLVLLAGWGGAVFGKPYFMNYFADILQQPTRFEQGYQLALQRWDNLTAEIGIALVMVVVHGALLWCFIRRKLSLRLMPLIFVVLFLLDTGRINGKMILLQDMPKQISGVKTAAMEYIAKSTDLSRTLVLNGTDPMQYASNKIPVLFTSNPVQQQRWQQYLENISLTSRALDIMTVRYLVMDLAQYQQDMAMLGNKYVPVFTDMARKEIVLENRTVLPKAWLVSAVYPVSPPEAILAQFQNSVFDPLRQAFVESQPPLPMSADVRDIDGSVQIDRFESRRIEISARTPVNALLVLGEKYYKGWRVRIDGTPADIQRVNYILRGVYLPAGNHRVEFVFDPTPFKVGKWLTLSSFAIFALVLLREVWLCRRCRKQRSCDHA
jgi:hypothetical protein